MTARIHDLGYRGYDGERLDEGAVARSLYVLGLRHAFGLGRSMKSRLLPLGLLAVSVLPALVMVAITVFIKLDRLPMTYDRYADTMQTITAIFVAAQAPVLFSRDLRFRTLPLYLARPMRRSTYVLTRLASLFTAILLVVTLPVIVLWLGALLGRLPWQAQTTDMLKTLPLLVLLAALLAAIGGLLSSLTTRRGIAVVAIVATLFVSSGVANSIAAIAQSADGSTPIQGVWAGALSPWTLVGGLGTWWFDFAPNLAPPRDLADGAVYLGVAALVILGGTALLLRRYAKVGSA